jgi:hypothetical protein
MGRGRLESGLRHFLTRRQPSFARVLLIESGSRSLIEHTIRTIYSLHGEQCRIDVVTCYAGRPAGLGEHSEVFRVSEYRGRSGRARLTLELRASQYNVAAIVCSAEAVMTNWKWWIAARLPVKFFVINENADWFWIDRAHWRVIAHVAMFRAGLTGGEAAASAARFALFPFMLAYLLLFAGWIHLRRMLRG